MIREPQVAEFLREDLQYLSLLADDRERGFYNTPFVSRNDSEEFLQKIVGELQVSLPQTTERSYIIQNTELATELVSTGSMYHLIQKDILIRDIKNNPIGNTAAKIQAVKDLDMQALEDTLGNKRDLENRFDYNIAEDIISQTTFTTSELENIFLGFPIVPVQDDARLLSEVKNQLSINNRNSIVTSDISLPTSQS